LAAPRSPWAHRFYSHDKRQRSGKRAAQRHLRYSHVRHRIYDAIGGAPHLD
jgi:hypothetical protein